MKNKRRTLLAGLSLATLVGLVSTANADNIFEEFFGSDDDEWYEDVPPWLLHGGGPYGGGMGAPYGGGYGYPYGGGSYPYYGGGYYNPYGGGYGYPYGGQGGGYGGY